ncbi:MAG: hypothetical protein AAGE65_04910 [Planctomycetota bacterium]
MFDDIPSEFWPAMRHVLWRYDANDALAVAYSYLNVAEAIAWFVIAAWVVRRAWVDPKTAWEWAYALAFVVFGLSDVWESYAVPMWLIAAKGLIFAAILGLRWRVKRDRPGLKL